MTGKNRRTLKKISYYPEASELYRQLTTSKGWPYKTNPAFYHSRDKALLSILYLLALRISEALRLTRNSFIQTEDRVKVVGIKLSKSRMKGKDRREQYRIDNALPLEGERKPFTKLVLDYLKLVEDQLPEEPIFRFGTKRAFQICIATLGIPLHWERAYGENYLYEAFDNDILAVSDYVKVDAGTLQQYIRGRFKKYPVS